MTPVRSPIHITLKPYTLQLRHTFTIAHSARGSTPALFCEAEYDGLVGYGEAAMPPYRGETIDSATRFIESIDFGSFDGYESLDRFLSRTCSSSPGNSAAKAAVDIALHDLWGKKKNLPLYRIWNLDLSAAPPTSFTIGIDTPGAVREKMRETGPYALLKVKLGGPDDRGLIETIRSVSDKPIRVDCNQGWSDRDDALDDIEWLALRGVELVEQPFHRSRIDDTAWLRERSPIPIVADESVEGVEDLDAIKGAYDGVNIKLMKCGGLRNARRMIDRCRTLGLKVMLGCMTESSCAISAAAQIVSLADWADLDGAALIANDPFEGAKIVDGVIRPAEQPGIGVKPRSG